VTESVLLGLLGGFFGLVLAKAGLQMALPSHGTIDPAVILFLCGISLATGILFGLAPAIHALRADPQWAIKSASVTGSGAGTRSALVVLEFGLTLMLVIGAGILTRSFLQMMQVNPGFSPAGVVTAKILAPPVAQPNVLFQRLHDGLAQLPGVESVSFTNALPLIA